MWGSFRQKLKKSVQKSRYAYLAAAVVILVGWGVALTHPPDNYMAWDAFGYDLYLPATFIYKDPGLHKQNTWLPRIYETYNPSPTNYQVVDIGRNKRVIKYPLGKALFDLPGFLVGHLIALSTNAPADGFSKPYQISLWIWNLILLSVGVLACMAALRLLFPDKVVAVLLLLLGLGTNYLLTAWLSSGLVHGLLFGLHAGMLYCTFVLLARPSVKYWTLLCLVLSAMCLLRPTEIVVTIIPLGILLPTYLHSWRRIKLATYLRVIFPAVVLGSLQLIYWKYVSNHWIFYSYNNAGEGLDVWHPHTIEFLFSFRKGWLLYSPVFWLIFPGFWALYKWKKTFFWPLIGCFVLFVWISSSWSNWWYAESFSQRGMVQFYPSLALVIGALWQKSTGASKKMIALFMVAATVLNLFQSWQFLKGILHPSRMTGAYYSAIFGKTTTPHGADTLLLVERKFISSGQMPRSELPFEPLPLPNTAELLGSDTHKLFPFETGWPLDSLFGGTHFWIRADIDVRTEQASSSGGSPTLYVITYAKHHDKVYAYQAIPWKLRAERQDTTVYFLSPEPTRPGDRYFFQLWNPQGIPMRFEKLNLAHYAVP